MKLTILESLVTMTRADLRSRGEESLIRGGFREGKMRITGNMNIRKPLL